MPVIVVLPGLAALVLAPDIERPDQAYPRMMTLLPPGIMGLVFAALVAAIVASLASKINSIATIFTLDIYKHMKKDTPETKLVTVGRITACVAVVLAVVAAKPLLGNFDQAFQYIQEFTGFFTPGIVVIFVLGMFWKRATTASAMTAAIGSAVLSLLFKLAWPSLPFMNRVGLVFVLSLAAAVLVSFIKPEQRAKNTITLEGIDYSTSNVFNTASIGVIVILIALYATWW